MAGSDQRHSFRGNGQYIFSNARLFPVPEFADRGDAFVPQTTLNLRDYDMLSNNMALENEPCHLHLHWNWHWHWHWHLPSPPQQVQVEAPHQTKRLLDEPEDFLLYDYYDTESDVEESDQEDIDVGGLNLEDGDNANNEANQSSLSDTEEREKVLVVGATRMFREGLEVEGGSTTHCEDLEYVLGDLQRCGSPLKEYEVEKRSPGGYKKRTWDDHEGEERSKRFCNEHEGIWKDF